MRETAAHAFSKESAGFSGSEFELEKEPELRPEPTEMALLESMQDPASEVLRAREAESQAAAAKAQAVDALHPAGQGTEGGGSAAAAAPALAPPDSIEEQRKILSEAPMFSAAIGQESEQSGKSGKKKLIIAAVVLLVAGGVYLALEKTHDQPTPNAAAPAVNQPQAAPVPAAQPTNPEPASPPPAEPSGDASPARRPSGSEKTPSSPRTPAKTKKTAWPAAPSDPGKRLV